MRLFICKVFYIIFKSRKKLTQLVLNITISNTARLNIQYKENIHNNKI